MKNNTISIALIFIILIAGCSNAKNNNMNENNSTPTNDNDISSLTFNGKEYNISEASYGPLFTDNGFKYAVLGFTAFRENEGVVDVTIYFQKSLLEDKSKREFHLGQIRVSVEYYKIDVEPHVSFQPMSGEISYEYSNEVINGLFKGTLQTKSNQNQLEISGGFKTKITWKCIVDSYDKGVVILEDWETNKDCADHINKIRFN